MAPVLKMWPFVKSNRIPLTHHVMRHEYSGRQSHRVQFTQQLHTGLEESKEIRTQFYYQINPDVHTG